MKKLEKIKCPEFKIINSKQFLNFIINKLQEYAIYDRNYNLLKFKNQDAFNSTIKIISTINYIIPINQIIKRTFNEFNSHANDIKNKDDYYKENYKITNSNYLNNIINELGELIIAGKYYKIIEPNFIISINPINLTEIENIRFLIKYNKFHELIQKILLGNMQLESENIKLNYNPKYLYDPIVIEGKYYLRIRSINNNAMIIYYNNTLYNSDKHYSCIIPIINEINESQEIKIGTFNERDFKSISIDIISNPYELFNYSPGKALGHCQPCSGGLNQTITVSDFSIESIREVQNTTEIEIQFRLCINSDCKCGLIGDYYLTNGLTASGISLEFFDQNNIPISQSPCRVKHVTPDLHYLTNSKYLYENHISPCLYPKFKLNLFADEDVRYCTLKIKVTVKDKCGCVYSTYFDMNVFAISCCQGSNREVDKETKNSNENRRLKQVLALTNLPFYHSVSCKSRYYKKVGNVWFDKKADYIGSYIDGFIYRACAIPKHFNNLNDQQWNDDNADFEYPLTHIANNIWMLRKQKLKGKSIVNDGNTSLYCENYFDDIVIDCQY